MAASRARRRFRAARLDQRDRLARGARPGGRARKGRRILDAFDVEAERADPGIVHQPVDHILDGEPCLIADGDDIADRERALVEEQIERDGAALADERDAARQPLTHDLVGPQRRAVEEVDEAVAIGAEVGQCAGGALELGW